MKRERYYRGCEPPLCSVAAAIVGAAVVGGAIQANGAENAANTMANEANQQSAAQRAAGQQAYNLDLNTIGQANQFYQPYADFGTSSLNKLNARMPELTASFNPTMDQLAQMPGYQFQLQQGLQAAQNGFAARGLGVSGAAMKGAAEYANGLASSNWQDSANLFFQNQNNAYNKLIGGVNIGAQAANAQSQNTVNLTGYAGNALMGQANQAANTAMTGAQGVAAGQMGAANALAAGINAGVGGYLGYKYLTNSGIYGKG